MDSPVRVLYVDGEATPAADPATVLEREDERFEVATVDGGQTGLERLGADPVDCVVADSSLPDVGAVEFVERAGEVDPSTPVVVLVASADGPVASEAVSRGAADHVPAAEVTTEHDLLATCVERAVERRECQRELRRHRRLVNTVGDPMFVLDDEGAVDFANDAMLEVLGGDRSKVVGAHGSELLADRDFERGATLLADLVRDSDRDWGTFEVTVEPLDGGPVPAEINLAPLLDDVGTLQGSVGVVRDLSDRKRRERRLAALHDTTRRLIEATDVEEALTVGIEAAADVLELEVAAFFRPADDGDVMETVAVTDGARELFDEIPAIKRGGGLVWDAHEGGEPIFADDVRDQPGVYNPDTAVGSELLIPAGDHGVFVAASPEPAGFDATDKELAGVLVSNLARAIDSIQREDRLRERERELEQYETMVRAFPDEVYTLDAEGRFTSIVPPTGSEHTTTGYTPEELEGEHVSKVIDEDAIEHAEDLIRDLLGSDDRERASFEMDTVTRDGERVPNENHIALLPTDDGFRGTVGVLRNIAERKERERERERQNERLEAFAHIASHDLRNPLNVAGGRLQLALEECDSDHLDAVAEALDRMETLIDDTLTMAKEGQSVTTTEPVDLDDLTTRCWDAVAGDDATLEVVDDVTVRGDPERLRRIIENLMRNAVEHGGEAVTVRIGAVADDGFYVADDGPGIPPEERESVFEAGHSSAEDGTGFGLAIVAELVEAHDWTIDLEESEDDGVRFEIRDVDVE